MPDREVNAETRVSDEKEAAIRRLRAELQKRDAEWGELAADNERLREALAAQTDFLELCGRHVPGWDDERHEHINRARAALAETEENAE